MKPIEEKKPILFMIIVFLKIFFFYFFMITFSHKTGNVEIIDSFSTFITYLFSKNTLIILVLSVATCIFSIITLIPASLITFIIEKYIKGVEETELPFYIAIIMSCFLFTCLTKINTHTELYLCYLVFLPFEKLKIIPILKRNKSVFIIWGIALLMIGFVVLTFKHLDEASSNKEYTNKFKVITNKENIYTDTSKKHVSGKVYICTGKSATVYHKYKDCKGLNRCRSKIKAVTTYEAKRMGRRECRICY